MWLNSLWRPSWSHEATDVVAAVVETSQTVYMHSCTTNVSIARRKAQVTFEDVYAAHEKQCLSLSQCYLLSC